MDNKQEQGIGGRKEPNLGQKEAKREKAEKQHQADEGHGHEKGGYKPQSDVMRKHRQVRP